MDSSEELPLKDPPLLPASSSGSILDIRAWLDALFDIQVFTRFVGSSSFSPPIFCELPGGMISLDWKFEEEFQPRQFFPASFRGSYDVCFNGYVRRTVQHTDAHALERYQAAFMWHLLSEKWRFISRYVYFRLPHDCHHYRKIFWMLTFSADSFPDLDYLVHKWFFRKVCLSSTSLERFFDASVISQKIFHLNKYFFRVTQSPLKLMNVILTVQQNK